MAGLDHETLLGWLTRLQLTAIRDQIRALPDGAGARRLRLQGPAQRRPAPGAGAGDVAVGGARRALLVLGPPGVGKTHIAIALGREAIRQSYSTGATDRPSPS